MESGRPGSAGGFTLIELLVVVLIVGILAAIAVPVFLNQREKAFRSATASDVRNAGLAMEAYSTDHFGGWTTDLLATGWTLSRGVTVEVNVYADGYCLLGRHQAFASDEAWIFNATGTIATAAILHHDTSGGSCPSAAVDTATLSG